MRYTCSHYWSVYTRYRRRVIGNLIPRCTATPLIARMTSQHTVFKSRARRKASFLSTTQSSLATPFASRLPTDEEASRARTPSARRMSLRSSCDPFDRSAKYTRGGSSTFSPIDLTALLDSSVCRRSRMADRRLSTSINRLDSIRPRRAASSASVADN